MQTDVPPIQFTDASVVVPLESAIVPGVPQRGRRHQGANRIDDVCRPLLCRRRRDRSEREHYEIALGTAPLAVNLASLSFGIDQYPTLDSTHIAVAQI